MNSYFPSLNYNLDTMVYWSTNLYQCLLFIVCIPILSYVNGNDETTTSDELTEFSERIVNGTKVKSGEFPYIVSLRKKKKMDLLCGGSLIKVQWVMSAAHCETKKGDIAVAGELQLNPPTQRRQTSVVKKIMAHPEHTFLHEHNDISLLLLETPFILNEYVQVTDWSLTGPPAGTMCTVAGWGYIKESYGKVSNDLLSVDVPLMSDEQCVKYFGKVVYLKSKLCAGYVEGGRDACQFDSGGPLECEGLLTGIVSAGLGCARPKHPGLYTRVRFFTDWIENTMAPPTVPPTVTTTVTPTVTPAVTSTVPSTVTSTVTPTVTSTVASISNSIKCSIISHVTFLYSFSPWTFSALIQYMFLK